MKITFSNGRTLALNGGHLAFIVIACLTALNGFVDSLRYEFVDYGNWSYCSFLYYPPDAYGDLLKPSFVAPPFVSADTSHWPPFIAHYYADNPYVQQNLQSSPHVAGLSFLHVTPITLMAHIMIKKLVLAYSPQFVIELFYIAAALGLAVVCAVMAPTWISALGVFLVLALSYPFLMIVSRGNMGALVDGVTLLLFFFFVLRRPHLWAAVAFLALAALFRPNVLFLCPVLLCLGFWRACLGSLVAAGCLAVGYAVFFYLDSLSYPGYGLAAHLAALKSYTATYIVGNLGVDFNNSAFGAVKLIVCCFHGADCSDIGGILQRVNLGLALGFSGLLLAPIFLYLRGRISALALAFATLCCFALATTIFGVYHLFVFAVFPLLLLHTAPDQPLSQANRVILLASIFILSPKDYLFIGGISTETILNPLCLATTLIWLIVAGFNAHRPGSAFSADELAAPAPS